MFGFKIKSPYIQLVGSVVNWGAGKDLDVVINGYMCTEDPVAEKTIGKLKYYLRSFQDRVHFLPNLYGTPFTKYVDAYDLECTLFESQRFAPIFVPTPRVEDEVISLGSIWDLLPETIVLEREFISKRGDVFFVKGFLMQEYSVPIAFRLVRQFPTFLQDKITVRFVEALPPGSQVMYSLVLRKRPLRVIEMIYAPGKKEEAVDAKERDKITISEFFFPCKPGLPPFPGSFDPETRTFNYEPTLRYYESIAPEGYEIYPVFVEKKYDGFRLIWVKTREQVRVWTDAGFDVSRKVPKMRDKMLRMLRDVPQAILDTEIEAWENGQHIPREEVSGMFRAKEPVKEDLLVVNVFDILAYEGRLKNNVVELIKDWFRDKEKLRLQFFEAEVESRGKKVPFASSDLHLLPLMLRRKILEHIPFKQSIMDIPKTGEFNLIPSLFANDREKLLKNLQICFAAPNSEGAVIKAVDSIYPLGGTSNRWGKSKKYVRLFVKVLRQSKTKTPGVFNYDFGVRFYEDVPEELVFEIKGKRYVFIGRTFNLAMDLEVGQNIVVRVHTVNRYVSQEQETVLCYESIFDGVTDKKEMRLEDVIDLARLAGLLSLKTVKKVPSRLPVLRQDPFMIFPDETKTYQFGLQVHYAAVAHGDLRMEFGDPDMVIGITLTFARPGMKRPESIRELKELIKQKKYWKVDFETGEFALRRRRGGVVTETYIYAEKKAPEPIEWLEIDEMEIQPGQVGATKYKKGFILTIDRGEVEYGAQKAYFHEYFYHGKILNGRYIFRRLPLKRQVLPPAQAPEMKPGQAVWLFIKPKDQTPYVVSKRAVDMKWLPPKGTSCLPKAIRKKVPSDLRFWEYDRKEALKVRRALREYLIEKDIIEREQDDFGSGIIVLEAAKRTRFYLKEVMFKGPKQIRVGPSLLVYYLYVAVDKKFKQITLESSPLADVPEIAATVADEKDLEIVKFTGYAPPKTKFNPTKETDCWITMLDSGEALVYEFGTYFAKVEFKGKRLKGMYLLEREPDTEIWVFRPTTPGAVE